MSDAVCGLLLFALSAEAEAARDGARALQWLDGVLFPLSLAQHSLVAVVVFQVPANRNQLQKSHHGSDMVGYHKCLDEKLKNGTYSAIKGVHSALCKC